MSIDSPTIHPPPNPVKFDEADYWALAGLFDPQRKYAGYRPNVTEIPNGNGVADSQKKFLHISLRYDPPAFAKRILFAAHGAALEVAQALDLPGHLFPSLDACALRVLEYPPGADSAPHTDFDMLTLNLWRSHPCAGLAAHEVAGYSVHYGELAELFDVAPADEHMVHATTHTQYSLVYFALPRHATLLPFAHTSAGLHTVSDWLRERIARSRSYK